MKATPRETDGDVSPPHIGAPRPEGKRGVGRRALLGAGAALALPGRGRAQQREYLFDQRFGRLSFSARHFGLLSSTGAFTRFDARVALDPDDPGQAEVAVSVAVGEIDLAWPGAQDMLRSPAYFDADRHPMAHFAGKAEGVSHPERFRLAGILTLRGIARPLAMEARLLGRGRDAAAGGEVAEFSAAGALDRTEYGMVADRTTVSDRIGLEVRVRLLLGP